MAVLAVRRVNYPSKPKIIYFCNLACSGCDTPKSLTSTFIILRSENELEKKVLETNIESCGAKSSIVEDGEKVFRLIPRPGPEIQEANSSDSINESLGERRQAFYAKHQQTSRYIIGGMPEKKNEVRRGKKKENFSYTQRLLVFISARRCLRGIIDDKQRCFSCCTSPPHRRNTNTTPQTKLRGFAFLSTSFPSSV